MMSASSVSIKGTAGEKVTLAKEVFEVKAPKGLLAQSVRVYLANQRRAMAKTKTRGEVAKTTAKMYKQKGTGRARHGSYSAPVFVGGGISHGPDGRQNYSLRITKKMGKRALLGALNEKAAAKSVSVITGGNKASGKTKDMKWLPTRSLVVVTQDQETLKRGVKNLATVITAKNLNPYLILVHKNLVISEEALEEMKKWLS